MNLKIEYRLTKPFQWWTHNWWVLGEKGALHLHITEYDEEFEKNHGMRQQGGVENHYRTPPDYMKGDAPSHNHCWILEAPCWHDGTSSWAEEYWIPFWLSHKNDHRAIFDLLERHYKERFEDGKNE